MSFDFKYAQKIHGWKDSEGPKPDKPIRKKKAAKKRQQPTRRSKRA